MIRINSDRLL